MKKNQAFPLLILLAIIAGVSSLVDMFSRAHAQGTCQEVSYPANKIKIIRMVQKNDNEWRENDKDDVPRSILPGTSKAAWTCAAMSWQDQLDLWEDPSHPVSHYVWTKVSSGDWWVYGFMPGHEHDPGKYSDMDVDVVCFSNDIADFKGPASQGLFHLDPRTKMVGPECECN